MESLETTLTLVFAALAAIAAVALGFTALRLSRGKSRAAAFAREVSVPVRALKAAAATGVVALGLGAWFATGVLLPLAPVADPLARWAFNVLLFAWCAGELALALTVPRALVEGSSWRKALLACGAAVTWGLSLVLLKDAPAVLSYPGPAESVMLAAPFEGRWLAAHAGASATTNHHARLPSQAYAADLVALGPAGTIRRGERSGSADYYTFGAPVLSPVSGRVAAAVDGHPDDLIPGKFEDIAGNHVAIEAGPGRYVFLAHLQRGSVRVAAGDFVARGRPIGLAGNSGNSDLPHLHVHVQDRPVISREAAALPYRLSGIRRCRAGLCLEVASSGVLRNDVIEPR